MDNSQHKIKQFQLGQFGEIYILFENSTMVQGEFEHITSDKRDSDMRINITRKIVISEVELEK